MVISYSSISYPQIGLILETSISIRQFTSISWSWATPSEMTQNISRNISFIGKFSFPYERMIIEKQTCDPFHTQHPQIRSVLSLYVVILCYGWHVADISINYLLGICFCCTFLLLTVYLSFSVQGAIKRQNKQFVIDFT